MNQTSYRGYDLEHKELVVGWQITITRDGKFVRNSSVAQLLSTVLDEAKKFVDGVTSTTDAGKETT
jgi:hypothetical protein